MIAVCHLCKVAAHWPCLVQNWLSMDHNWQLAREVKLGIRTFGSDSNVTFSNEFIVSGVVSNYDVLLRCSCSC